MKGLFSVALGLATVATTFGGLININTGVANWQYYSTATSSFVNAVVVVPTNGTWAPAPTSSSWVSFGAIEGTSCAVGQTPGNGCAHTLVNPLGDVLTYQLVISAASLGATSGTVNFVFGSDNRVTMFVGTGPPSYIWNGGSSSNGTGFNPLGCSANPPTSAGSSQATYNNCTTTVSFNASTLNADGSLTLTAYNYNDPIPGCPACGDPTGWILAGTVSTGAAATPEPATFGLVALAGLAGLALRRKRSN